MQASGVQAQIHETISVNLSEDKRSEMHLQYFCLCTTVQARVYSSTQGSSVSFFDYSMFHTLSQWMFCYCILACNGSDKRTQKHLQYFGLHVLQAVEYELSIQGPYSIKHTVGLGLCQLASLLHHTTVCFIHYHMYCMWSQDFTQPAIALSLSSSSVCVCVCAQRELTTVVIG